MLELKATTDCLKNDCEKKKLEYENNIKNYKKQIEILENQLKSISNGESNLILFNEPVNFKIKFLIINIFFTNRIS